MKWYLPAAILITAVLNAACSGGGNMGTHLFGTEKGVIAGQVADGYLVGATVFLDKNGNYLLDADEPYTTTGSDGSYTLTVDPGDVGKYPVVALVIKDVTIDLDNPGQPVQSTYVLSMHAVSINTSATGEVIGNTSNFISPISTQIRELMETGKYASVQDAATALRTKLGMPQGIDMTANYFKFSSYSSAMHTSARNMAVLMGGQTSKIMGTSGSPATMDVNRYRGMMGTIFSQISSVKWPNDQAAMANLQVAMGSALENMPMTPPGKPFRNMSAAFRGGMIGGGNDSATVQFQTLKTGMSYTGQLGLSVLRTHQEWSDFWNELNTPKYPIGTPIDTSQIPALPPVDFSSTYVIVVHYGYPTGGFSFGITSLRSSATGLIVSVNQRSPGSNCIVTQAFVYPYQIITTPIFTGEAVLNMTNMVYSCNF